MFQKEMRHSAYTLRINMLHFFLPCIVLISVYATRDSRKIFVQDDVVTNVQMFYSCVSITATTLFDNGNDISIICYKCDYLENEIIKLFMKNMPIMISDKPMLIQNRRHLSYVVFATESFMKSRRTLLKHDETLRMLQYLFVSRAEKENVIAFASELWHVGFRDIAFLTRNNSNSDATIQVPSIMNNTIILNTVGYCSSSGNNLSDVRPYSDNLYRFCAKIPCTLLFGVIVDEKTLYWQGENILKLQGTEDFRYFEDMLLDRFTYFYGIKSYRQDNLSWWQAVKKLNNGELDIAIGMMPDNLKIMKNLKIVCWVRNLNIVFAANVRNREFYDYPVLKLLTLFHYSVWICTIVILLLYILLFYALRKLTAMRLIKERVNYIQICEIMLEQSTSFPKKMSLRVILGLWVIFSLHISTIYNSVFSSSLTDTNTEILLSNLEELRDSDMTIAGPSIIQNFLNDSNDPVMKDLYNRYIVMNSADQTLDAIFSNNTMAVIQHATANRINWATRMNRSLRIYMLAEPVLSFSVLFYTRQAHPYRESLGRIVTEYRESGLFYKWIKNYIIDENKQIVKNKEEDDDSNILTLEHLGPVFQFFLMCQTISVLVFLLELFKVYVFKIC